MYKLLSSNLCPVCRRVEGTHTHTWCGWKINGLIVATAPGWSTCINIAPDTALHLFPLILARGCLVFQKAEVNTAEHGADLVTTCESEEGFRRRRTRKKESVSLQVTVDKVAHKALGGGCLRGWRLGAISVYKAASLSSKASAGTKRKESNLFPRLRLGGCVSSLLLSDRDFTGYIATGWKQAHRQAHPRTHKDTKTLLTPSSSLVTRVSNSYQKKTELSCLKCLVWI